MLNEKINIEIKETMEEELDISENSIVNFSQSNVFRELLVNNYFNNKKIKVYVSKKKKIDKKIYNLVRNTNFLKSKVKNRNIIISSLNDELSSEESIEDDDEFVCRICFEEDDESNLISPCNCIGSQKYIHLECLNRWRSTNINNPEKRDICDICKEPYNTLLETAITRTIVSTRNLINNSWLYFFSRYGFIIGFSLLYSMFDINAGFFTFNILTVYSIDNEKSNIISNFNYISKDVGVLGLINSMVFWSFNLAFINYIFNLFYFNKIKSRGLFFTDYHIRYSILVKKTYNLTILQYHLFPLFFYSAVIVNNYNILAFSMIIVFIINSLSIENYTNVHNSAIRLILA